MINWFLKLDIMGKIYVLIALFIIVVSIITIVTRERKTNELVENNVVYQNEIHNNIKDN